MAEKENKTAAAVVPAAAEAAEGEQLISVYLPKSESDKEDYVGSINGFKFTVKRGVTAFLTKDQYAVFQNSLDQSAYVSDLIDAHAERARKAGIK